MAKASLKLPNGTLVQIEGTAAEVRELLQGYGALAATVSGGGTPATPAARAGHKQTRAPARAVAASKRGTDADGTVDLNQIVNLVKICDEAEGIEKQILDRTSQVDRTLLPLYIVHEHLGNAFGLTSGEINKITTDLGVPVSQPNASRTLSSTAAKYVIGDAVRTRGQPVRYRLHLRGVKYLKAVIAGKSDENAG